MSTNAYRDLGGNRSTPYRGHSGSVVDLDAARLRYRRPVENEPYYKANPTTVAQELRRAREATNAGKASLAQKVAAGKWGTDD